MEGRAIDISSVRLSENEVHELEKLRVSLCDFLGDGRINQSDLIRIAVDLFIIQYLDRKISFSVLAKLFQ